MSRYNLRSRKNDHTSDLSSDEANSSEKPSEKKVKQDNEKNKQDKGKKQDRMSKEEMELLDLYMQDLEEDEEDGDYTPSPMDKEEKNEYIRAIKNMLEGIEEEEEEEEDDEMNEGFIDDSEMEEQKNALAMMMLRHILQQTEDPFDGAKLTKKQEKLHKKLMGRIEKEEPTPQRILGSKMPNSEKVKLIKAFTGYSQMQEDTFEYWMFRDMLNEKLKEWETLDKKEGKELKKVMKKVNGKQSILHQIAQLKAPEPVKEGIITLYNTSDMEDGTHSSRLRSVLNIPFTQLRPTPYQDKPKHILLQHVKQTLDDHLYGLEGVKRELLIALNIRLSNPKVSTAILLNGKAGVGKTMMAHVLAKALGLYFHKISLGNIDHAQVLTGGESIWKGSSLSSITQALIEAKSKNPIILLDEIDKNRGKGNANSVENALLQILDPTQNHNFRDLNIPEVPIDLSSVWWIATSNSTEKLSRPLLSRLRLIEVPDYSMDDLKNIVRRYVIPSICKKCVVDEKRIELDEKVLSRVLLENKKNIDELGVRFLEGLFEKTIGNLLLDEVLSDGTRKEKLVIGMEDIQKKKEDYSHMMYL